MGEETRQEVTATEARGNRTEHRQQLQRRKGSDMDPEGTSSLPGEKAMVVSGPVLSGQE